LSGNINQCPGDFSGGDKHYAADDSGPIDKYACDSDLGRFGKEEEADESQYPHENAELANGCENSCDNA